MTEEVSGQPALRHFRRVPGSEGAGADDTTSVCQAQVGGAGLGSPRAPHTKLAMSPEAYSSLSGTQEHSSTIPGTSCLLRGHHAAGQLWLSKHPSSHCAETCPPHGMVLGLPSASPVSFLPQPSSRLMTDPAVWGQEGRV